MKTKNSGRSWSDEEVMSFVDGEADAATTAHIDRDARSDAQLTRRIAQYRRSSDLAKQAFPLDLDTDKGVELTALIRSTLAEPVAAPVVPVADNDNRWSARQTAMAASVAAILAGFTGYYTASTPQADRATLAAFNQFLDTVPTGASVELKQGKATVIASFGGAGKPLCRETETLGSGLTETAIHCRFDGNWQTVYLAAFTKQADGFAPASSAAAVEAYLTAAGFEEPLSADEELKALSAAKLD